MLCYVSLGLWQLKLCGRVPALDALLQLRAGTWCATADAVRVAIGRPRALLFRRRSGAQTWRFEPAATLVLRNARRREACSKKAPTRRSRTRAFARRGVSVLQQCRVFGAAAGRIDGRCGILNPDVDVFYSAAGPAKVFVLRLVIAAK